MAVNIQTIFLIETSFDLAGDYQRFGEKYDFHLQDQFSS